MLFDIYKVCIFIGMYCFMFGFDIVESSQGILLDEKYGFRPNTTYLDTSLDSLKNINGK